MSANFRYARREYHPPTLQGLHFGGHPYLLIRTPERALIWIPGHSAYINRMTGSVYAEASMWRMKRGGDMVNERTWPKICKGGRLVSRLRDPAVVEKIEREFGEGVVGLIDPKKTLLLGESEPFPNTFYRWKEGRFWETRFIGSVWGDNHPVEYDAC